MNTQQSVVAAGGLALVAANWWTGSRKTIFAGAFNSSASTAQEAAAHKALYALGLQLLFVAVAAFLAGINTSLGNAMLAMIAALAILWLITYNTKGH